MTTQLVNQPHVYKKGKILKFKSLDPLTPKMYYFTSDETKPSLASLTKHCNNINQIIARCLFKITKITSYFGIQKDKNETSNKTKIPYNSFWINFQKHKENEYLEIMNSLREVNKRLIQRAFFDNQINDKLANLENKLEEIRVVQRIFIENRINDKLLNLGHKLEEISKVINKIVDV